MDELDDETPDAVLLERLRDGDREAAVDLWTRHYPSVLLAARRVTRQPRDAEEIASDAFTGMLSALSGGAGPNTSVRAYLVTSVRNLAASRATRSSASDVMTDDVALFDKPTADTTAHMSELQLVRVAFAELPQRWQVVLWRTAVDKDSNIEVGRAMGLSPNGVAALAKRARRGFRLSYLRAHLSDRGIEAQCRPFIDGLADLSISESDGPALLRDHVAGCAACTRRLDELRSVNLNFAGALGPAVFALVPSKLLVGLVGASTAAVGATGSAGGVGGASLAGAGGTPGNVLGFRPGARWALGSVALAGAVVAIVVSARPELMITPPVGQTMPSAPRASAPSSTSTTTRAVPTPSTTTTVKPPSATTRATSRPRPSSTPSPPSASTATRRPSAPSTTSAPRTSPLSVDLSFAGPRSSTSIAVSAAAQGIAGPVRLTLQLPDGVTLTGASGDWGSCTQGPTAVTCTADAAATGRWSGTIRTVWAPDARGRVRATVQGTYANGSPAVGSVGTTWPP